MHRYRRLIAYVLRERRSLLLILALTAGSALAAALQPWPLKILFDWALGGLAPPPPLRPWLAAVGAVGAPGRMIGVAAAAALAVFALQSALDAGLTWAWSAAGQRMVYSLAADLFRRLQRLSLLFHSRRSVGDSLSRLTGDAWCLHTVADGLLIGPLNNLFTLATLGAVAWRLDPAMAALSVGMAPVLGATAFWFGRRLKRRGAASREAQSRLVSFVHQTMTSLPVVSAFGAEWRNRRQFGRLAASTTAAAQRQTVLRGAYGLVNGLITAAGAALLIYVGGRRVLEHALPLGSLLVLLGYLRSLQGAAQGLMGIYGTLKSVEASVDRVIEVLDCPEEVREPERPTPLPIPARGHVRLENVTFGYEPGRPVLRNVDLEARPGETLALVGSTGAGKSTLASLIPRLYDPWQGRVLFDGVDARDVRLAELRAGVALVLQDPFLLPLTAAENIAYGRPGAPGAQIVAAAEAAGADEFIRQLPAGYDTVIGERGATLSGGQRQRLAIARALLKDAPVLVLDEPTAALDPGTEALVMAAVRRLMRGRTTFLIAHRLSTARRADRIAVLEDGRIEAVGTHAELIAAGGAYRRLHEAQFAPGTRGTTDG